MSATYPITFANLSGNIPLNYLDSNFTYIGSYVDANSLPSQTSNSGKFLTTNGTTASWVSVYGAANTWTGTQTYTGLVETKTSLPANNFDLSTGTYFSKTISGNTTLTVTNIPATGLTASFIIDLTNGGSATITWGSGFTAMHYSGGVAPILSVSGRDRVGLITSDGGANWDLLLLAKAIS